MSVPATTPDQSLQYGKAKVRIFATREELGRAAAQDAAAFIRHAIVERGSARIMVATGNSQLDVVKHLVLQPGIDWSVVDVFHMDEYVGIDDRHPAGFRRWIRERVEEKVCARSVHYINGESDIDAEIKRYTALLSEGPIDVAFVGIGENGHIAFNDPLVADFNDPHMLKRVRLDETSRQQQVNEGHFPSIASVPEEAISVTCSGLLRARAWISCVPEGRKAAAVKAALEGPVTTECPGSIARTRDHVTIYLDSDSSARLNL